jgi:hypothetical protein
MCLSVNKFKKIYLYFGPDVRGDAKIWSQLDKAEDENQNILLIAKTLLSTEISQAPVILSILIILCHRTKIDQKDFLGP